MKLLKYLLITGLVFALVLIAPGYSQTPTLRLPLSLNAALCVNNWDRALTLVQQMLGSVDLSVGDSPQERQSQRTQLTTLANQIRQYQASGRPVDQSDACSAAIGPGEGSTIALQPARSSCPAGNLAVNGRCLGNPTAARRYSRSVEEGDSQ